MKKINNIHHLCPRSRIEWDINNPDNLKKVNSNFHIAFHQVFENLLPHEQMAYILTFNKSVLNLKFVREVKDILEDKNYKYRDWIFIKE